MFYRLILAHLVGDFVLQPRGLVARKTTPGGLAVHTGIVGLAMLPLAWQRLAAWWPWLLVILVVHAIVDWAKVQLGPQLRLPPIVPFLADQAVHVLTIAVVVAVVESDGFGPALGETEPLWWIASLYVIATFALSIALPLWLDPSNLMKRPPAARLTIITASAVVLTLAWRGWPVLIPVVAVILYQAVVRRLGRAPVTKTFPVEFWSAVVLSASLGWVLL
jgi:hypothetical protein